jgi:hypothetical protein
MAVAWPRGYSARYVGSEVEVLDWYGKVAATTGKRYYLSGPVPSTEEFGLPTSAWTACGIPPYELS